MEPIDAVLSEVDKLQLAAPFPEPTHPVNFEKYIGIGKGVWGPDAQTYINESRTDI